MGGRKTVMVKVNLNFFSWWSYSAWSVPSAPDIENKTNFKKYKILNTNYLCTKNYRILSPPLEKNSFVFALWRIQHKNIILNVNFFTFDAFYHMYSINRGYNRRKKAQFYTFFFEKHLMERDRCYCVHSTTYLICNFKKRKLFELF